MKLFRAFSVSVLLLIFGASCAHKPVLVAGSSLQLASSVENGVSVSVALALDSHGRAWLEAIYIPERAGFHLYSTGLPRNGINGEGRPTLLELPGGSKIRATGDLAVSADAEVASMGPNALLVYPAGPVKLSLPIAFPAGKGWIEEQIRITYEACSDMSCLPPVVDKLIPIRIPSANMVEKPPDP